LIFHRKADAPFLFNQIFFPQQKQIMHEQNISPRRTACSWINNVAGDFLESGQYHIYRGALNPVGEAYLQIFDKSTDILFEVGDMTKERAEQHKQDMRKCIQGVG
jgi:hypothetical protein